MVVPQPTIPAECDAAAAVLVAPPPPPPDVVMSAPFPSSSVPAGQVILKTTALHPSVHVSPTPITSVSMVSVVSAPQSLPTLQRPSLRVMCVVDTSGSMMQEGKLEAVRSALQYVVSTLSPSDEFGLVSFSDAATEHLPMTRVVPSSAPQIGNTIARLNARGNTNLSQGLLKAITVLHPMQQPYGGRRASKKVTGPYGYPSPYGVGPYGYPASGPYGVIATSLPPPVQQPLPTFYLAATRSLDQGSGTASLLVQGVLPTVASHLLVSAHGQLGTIQCAPGVPVPVWPDVPLTFSVVLKNPRSTVVFAPLTVNLQHAVPSHLAFTSAAAAATVTAPTTTVSATAAKPLDLVLLFTDGEANLGVTDPDTLAALMTRTLAQHGSTASFVTFGFGTTHNATLLRRLATGTQGTYYFVPSSLDIPKLFGDCLGGFMSVVARNIVVRVSPLSSLVTITGVRSSYPVSRDPSGGFRIQMKDLFAEERRDLIVDVTVDPNALVAPMPALPWFTATVSSEDPRGITTTSGTVTMEVPVVPLPYIGSSNVEVEEQVGRLAAAEAIEAATNFASAGDFAHAREHLARARVMQPVAMSSFARCVMSDLKAMEEDMTDAAHWAKGGAMNANTMQAQHAQQRCNAPVAASAAHYQTKAKSLGAARAVAFASNGVPPTS